MRHVIASPTTVSNFFILIKLFGLRKCTVACEERLYNVKLWASMIWNRVRGHILQSLVLFLLTSWATKGTTLIWPISYPVSSRMRAPSLAQRHYSTSSSPEQQPHITHIVKKIKSPSRPLNEHWCGFRIRRWTDGQRTEEVNRECLRALVVVCTVSSAILAFPSHHSRKVQTLRHSYHTTSRDVANSDVRSLLGNYCVCVVVE